MMSRDDRPGREQTPQELPNADLRGFDLTGADLSGGDLRFADLREARYNNATKWPEGFNPAEAGAVNVDEEPK